MNNNINPLLWGENGWKFMHWITLGYKDNPNNYEKINMKNFFHSVGNILPCTSCRENFVKHLKKYPLGDYELSSRNALVNWLMNIHNEVNILYGKKIYTTDMLYNEYLYGRNSHTFQFSLLYYLIILIIILLIIYFFRRYIKR